MKWLKLAGPIALAAALCGCSATGLGDKVIVKALVLDYQQQYIAQMLVLEPQPSADAGEASETIRLIEGNGESLSEAIGQAEQSSAEEMFYGQNELLLIGPGLQQKGVPECCRFLYENSAGRPNMAVWGIDIPADRQPLTEENASDVIEGIHRLEKRGEFHTYLYQFAAAQGGGFLPLVQLSEEGNVQLQGVALYRGGQPAERFTDGETELAALFSGQSGTGQIRIETEDGPITLTIRSPKMLYECTERNDSMQLVIRFSGHVEQMVGETIPSQKQERRALLKQINQQLEQMGSDVIRRAFCPDSDPFGFLNRFRNRNERLAMALVQNETLYRQKTVTFTSTLQLL